LLVKPPRHRDKCRQSHSGQRRRLTTVIALLAVGVLPVAGGPIGLTSTVEGTATANPAPARQARTLAATDTAHLHYVRHSGSQLFEEGSASGTLPGTMRAHCNIGPTLSANFTIYTRGGSITGRGRASVTPSSSGHASRYESFHGSLVVTSGTGRYGRAHGKAGFYGTFDRRTYALVIQTTGRLSY
jgi:hypothetical protein